MKSILIATTLTLGIYGAGVTAFAGATGLMEEDRFEADGGATTPPGSGLEADSETEDQGPLDQGPSIESEGDWRRGESHTETVRNEHALLVEETPITVPGGREGARPIWTSRDASMDPEEGTISGDTRP